MIHNISRYLLTLVALLAMTTGAWAQDNRFFLEVSGTSATLKWGEPISNDNPSSYPGSSWRYQGNDWTDKSGITTITVDASCTNCSKDNISALFYNFVDLQTINNIENIKTDAVKYLGSMFQNCTSLQTLDLSSWNTENVTSMNGMFRGCTSLQTLDISSFNTGKVYGMSYMFKDCSTLTTIYVGDGWSTDQLTSSSSSTNMFDGCVSLPNWDNASPVIDKTNAHTGDGGYLTYKTSAPDVEVTTNAASEGATFTEATFAMPAFDATADYELVRDMTVSVIPVIADRIRIKKDGTTYVPVTATELVPVVLDALDQDKDPVQMTATTDYTVKLQKKVEGDTPSWADAEVLSVGTFRYVITGTNLYDGEITTNEFTLFEGFEVTVPAGEYATFYKDENLYVEDPEAQLYTITSVGTETATATELTVAKALTPILVKNNGQEKKVILLIPTATEGDEVDYAPEFVGTLEATTIAASSENQNNYAFNGLQFVWVKNAIEIGANKAWLSISNSNARAITLVFDDATAIEMVNGQSSMVNGTWYDLNGRKLNGMPTKKGIYMNNGRKVVVK